VHAWKKFDDNNKFLITQKPNIFTTILIYTNIINLINSNTYYTQLAFKGTL